MADTRYPYVTPYAWLLGSMSLLNQKAGDVAIDPSKHNVMELAVYYEYLKLRMDNWLDLHKGKIDLDEAFDAAQDLIKTYEDLKNDIDGV